MSSSEVRAEIISWIKFILAAVICTLVINKFIIFNAFVPTGSMENTIMPNDRVFGLRIPYYWGKPERFDIAIFIPPDEPDTYYVKRVIGLPGEKVEFRAGKVYINDSAEPLPDDFTKEEPRIEETWAPFNVPEGCYFMLGDNRNNSTDSRYWTSTHYVAEDAILAKGVFRLWPHPGLLK